MFYQWPLTFNAEQAAHWPWLIKVTEADMVRFDTKWIVVAAPVGLGLVGPCNLWTGGTSVGGQKGHKAEPYGSFWVKGTAVRAHIFAALACGTFENIPHAPGLHVDHKCCRPLCVAGPHLEPVPQEENQRRKR